MKTNFGLLKRYQKIAGRWNSYEYDGLRRDDMIADILSCSNLKALPPAPHILDAMCGTGKIGQAVENLLRKARKEPKMLFLDFSRAMLEQITASGEKIASDIRKTPFPENYFDRVFIRCALHDLPKESQREAVKEIYRVLKPGGLFILVVAHVEAEAQESFNKIVRLKDVLAGNADEMRRYFGTKEELCALLSGAGFKIVANPLDYEGEITYAGTGEIGSKDGQRSIDDYMENLSEKVKKSLKVRKSKEGVTINFPFAVLTANK